MQITFFSLVCMVTFLQGNTDPRGVHTGLGELEHYSLKQYLQKIASISKGKYTKNLLLRQKKEKTKFTMLKRL